MLTPFAGARPRHQRGHQISGAARSAPTNGHGVGSRRRTAIPRQFPRPDVVRHDRDPNPHLAFGRGIHFCVGAPLARLEGKVATNLLLDRYPHLRCDPQDPPVFLPTPNMTGAQRLPLLLS